MPALRHLDLGYSHCPPNVLAQLAAAAPQLRVAVAPLPRAYTTAAGIRCKMAEEDRKDRVWRGLEAPNPAPDWMWLDEARSAAGWSSEEGGGADWYGSGSEEDAW